jgi:hypothetical protein
MPFGRLSRGTSLAAPASVRILTFNWHESYLHLLAGTGFEWDAVLRAKGGRGDWWSEVRPVPANMRLVDDDTARARTAAGEYGLAICHNLLDLQFVAGSHLPAVLVFHTSRELERAFGFDEARWNDAGVKLAKRASIVFVSPAKQASWDLDGRVILPGVDTTIYGGYEGGTPCALHVGNLKRELASVSGIDVLERVMSGLPLTLRGLNPHIPGTRLSASCEELRETMRTHRLYVNVTKAPFEDGYNLAMLEAMATGMPIVTTAHPTSPIVDGVSGYASDDPAVLRERVLELLEDADRARELGAAARACVADRFSLERFRDAWRTVINEVSAAGRRERSQVTT